MSRGKLFNRPSAAATLRRLNAGKMRDLLLAVSPGRGRKAWWSAGDAFTATHNRHARRMLAHAQRKRGRGYTTPLSGRAHTRGTGTNRH